MFTSDKGKTKLLAQISLKQKQYWVIFNVRWSLNDILYTRLNFQFPNRFSAISPTVVMALGYWAKECYHISKRQRRYFSKSLRHNTSRLSTLLWISQNTGHRAISPNREIPYLMFQPRDQNSPKKDGKASSATVRPYQQRNLPHAR